MRTLPQQLRPHRDQGDRVRRTGGKHGSRARRKIERQENRERLRARATQYTFKREVKPLQDSHSNRLHTLKPGIEAIDQRAVDPRVTPIRQTVKQA